MTAAKQAQHRAEDEAEASESANTSLKENLEDERAKQREMKSQIRLLEAELAKERKEVTCNALLCALSPV